MARMEFLEDEKESRFFRAIDERDMAALDAVFKDEPAIVNAMISDGISLPLFCVISRGNCEAVEVLLRNRADPNYRDIEGTAPLEHLLWTWPEHAITILELLIGAGAEVNAPAFQPHSNFTPSLHTAVLSNHVDAILLLLAAGAKIDAVDGERRTALDVARNAALAAAKRDRSGKKALDIAHNAACAEVVTVLESYQRTKLR